MSYLSYPRLHFSGGFLADPSTINNTPNNYDTENSEISQLELYWNPNGTGIFDFENCYVTKVVYAPGEEATKADQDPIVGQSLMAVYSKAAAKIVDLDPDQQNVSEIWGFTVQVGGVGINPPPIKNFLRGEFVENSFNAIWGQAQNGPPSSASGSGVYQSRLKNLAWDVSATPGSKFLTQLNACSAKQLSMNFVVTAHNNSPDIYKFDTKTTLKALTESPYNIPEDIVAKLTPMTKYKIMSYSTAGEVPTESYVNHEVRRLLGQQDAQTYGSNILKGTYQKPTTPSVMPTSFPRGLVTGTIGPQDESSPTYYTPSRTLAPYADTALAFYAPFNVDTVGVESRVVLNLGNALATDTPGFDVYTDKLGDLTLVYFDQQVQPGISIENAIPFASIPTDINSELANSAGIVELTVNTDILPKGVTAEEANLLLLSMPLGLVNKPNGQAITTIWSAENINGYSMRADKFVYRMNPGIKTSDSQAMGSTAEVSIYVKQFGRPAPNVGITLKLLSEKNAIKYTSKTLGTSGTAGIKNLSIPQEALSWPGQTVGPDNQLQSVITTDDTGKATIRLTASDPGTPRANQDLDGQIYFITYDFSDSKLAPGFLKSSDDLLSIHVYSELTIPESPTWSNCIKNILPQYAKLYPIMGRFKLNSYSSVVENSEAIKTVLSLPMDDALHMPVIRDLSIVRTNAVLSWINNGTPE